MMLMMMMMIAIAWASLQLFKSNVKEKQKHDVSMTSGLHQTMAAYKDAASKFTMEPLEPFKRVSHICFSCSIWPFWGSLQRLFRKLAVCSKQCWRSRFGGFLKWRYRKSSKSLDHDLVLEAMVTTGDPFFGTSICGISPRIQHGWKIIRWVGWFSWIYWSWKNFVIMTSLLRLSFCLSFVKYVCISTHRIHGAGIYANMTGVYWWDPCYHI